LNFASLSNAYNGTNSGYSGITTFNAGVFVDFKIGNFSLQPALNYTGKGGSYNEILYYFYPDLYPGPAISNEPGTEKVKEQLYYLQLPVNIVYHIPVVIGNIYFGAGPYVAQGLSGKTTYTEGSTFGNSADDVKATQFGADAIIGFKLRNGLLINANYDLGLTNDVPAAEGGNKSKSHVFGISVGYVFL